MTTKKEIGHHRQVTVFASINAGTSVAFSANGQLCNNLPFDPASGENAGAGANHSRNGGQSVCGIPSGAVHATEAQGAVVGFDFIITYFV